MNTTARERGYNMLSNKNAGERVKSSEFISMIDFTNPEAVSWWQTEGPAKVLKDGVKGFKFDRADVFVP